MEKTRYINRCCVFILVSIPLLMLNSCQSKQYTRELATLDSLQRVLDSSIFQYRQLDTSAIGAMFSAIQTDLKFIRANRSPNDTLSLQEAQQLNTYAQVYSVLGALIERKPGVVKELLYTSRQLVSLKADVEKGKWEEIEVKRYCEQEKEAVNHLQGVVQKASAALKESKSRYTDVQPKVVLLKERLRPAAKLQSDKK